MSGSSARAAILLTLASVTGCADQDQAPPPRVVAQLSKDVLAGIDRTRARIPAVSVEKLEPVFRLELPNDEAPSFRMQGAVALAAFGVPDCIVLIGDTSDLAIHWFGGSRAAYMHSVFLGGREAPLITELTDLDAATPDIVAVSDRNRGRVVRVDAEGRLLSVMEIPIQREGSSLLPAYRIALGPDSTVIEQPMWRGSLADYPGLVRVWEGDGRFRHYLGPVVRSGGPEFAETLSLGNFLVRGDTLWTLRRIDGRLLAYDISGMESAALVSHELPLFFEMDSPTIVLRDSISGETAVAAARHAGTFAMDQKGNFFVEQLREDRTPILGTMTSDGTAYRAFDLGVARIRALAATLEHLFAAVVLPGERDAVVLAYRSPFSRDSVGRDTCHRVAFPAS